MRRHDPGRFAARLALVLATWTGVLTGAIRHRAETPLNQAEALEFYASRHAAVHRMTQHQLRGLHRQHVHPEPFQY